MAFYERYTQSGGAFGFFDDWPNGTVTLPVVGEVSSSYRGLSNTLFIEKPFLSGGKAILLLAPSGYSPDVNKSINLFSVRIEFGGSVTAAVAGFEVDLANLRVTRNALYVNIAGEEKVYGRDNVEALKADLIALGVSDSAAENFKDTVVTTFNTITRAEAWALTTYKELMGTLDQSGISSAVVTDLSSRVATAEGADSVSLGEVTNVIATSFDDTITGNGLNNSLSGGAGADTISGGGGDDVIDGGSGADVLSGGAGSDTYRASDGDTISDSDGKGQVIFDGLLLRGAKRDDEDPDPHDCEDPSNLPPDTSEDDDRYIGDAGEEYILEGGGLRVIYNGAEITITGWSDGDLGITLEDEEPDPEEWTPPDCFRSPLVFDLDGDGIEITALSASFAYFDIDNDGDSERTAWVGPDDGLLAIDLNGDGQIFGGGELFGYGGTFSGANGNASLLPGFEDGGRLVGPGGLDIVYESGFDKLAALDFNQDGVIDSVDTFYNQLVVWRDLDGDGTSDEGELFGLAESGIASISLTAVRGDVPIADSIISDTGSYVGTDGVTREVSDVWFRFSQFDTVYDDSNVTEEIAALPFIRGTGALRDLDVAMADDPVLLQMVTDLSGLGAGDLASYRGKVQDILYRWAGVEDVDPFGRGASADGQKLGFVEVVSDTPFAQWSGANPRATAGLLLDLQFETILRDMMVRFAGQTAFGDAVIPQISFNNGAFIALEDGTTSSDMLDAIFASAPEEWAAAFAHLQAGIMMLDRIHQSFADVEVAGDEGEAYRADVAARMADAGFTGFAYADIVSANIGTDADEGIITPSLFGFQFFVPTDVTLTGAGDDDVKWGNKIEILLWGRGQGNDELDVDLFFAQPFFPSGINNTVRMIELNRDDVTIGRGDGPISNDIVFTINDTGETLTFRNLLLADNVQAGGIEFADGEILALEDLEPLLSELAETGTDGDDLLYQRSGTTLDGGAGDDVMRGGREATTYVFGTGYGSDEIYDDRFLGDANTVEFGPGLTFEDLTFERPPFGNLADLIIGITGTDDTLRISNQFNSTRFVVETFRFEDGSFLTGLDVLDILLEDTAGSDRLVGSGLDERFGDNSPGDDVFTGLQGQDTYVFNASSGTDLVIEGLRDRYDPDRPISFYRDFFVENERGDLVEIEFAFEDLNVSRTATRLTFEHEPSGAMLIVDNTQGHVERYTFAGDDTVYTLPEVMNMIDEAIDPTNGSENDDILIGDDAGNIISGGDGDDQIFGLAGDDLLQGDAGDDLLDGGDRGETPAALRGDNILEGGTGNDTLLGGWGGDILRGGEGNDTLFGDFGDDVYDGGTGDDLILARDGDAVYLYDLGDGNDLLITTDDRFDTTEVQLGAGITPEDVTYRITNVDITGLTDFNGFRDTSWALEMTFADGGTITMAGSPFASNLPGVDTLTFTETVTSVSFDSIIADLYAPSDEDQIFVDGRGADVFAPGGGSDLLVYERGGSDTLSLGLGDGENTVLGFLERIVFEGGVSVAGTEFERYGERFENLRITLEDDTSVTVPGIFRTGQTNEGTVLTQSLVLNQLVFADGTTITGQQLLDDALTSTAGDDVMTGASLSDTLVQSAGNDLLRGAGGSDIYFFGAGAGQDTVDERSEGPTVRSNNFEGTFYDLSQLRERDELRFGDGITLDDLTLTQTGTTLSDLRIDLAGTEDSILLLDQFMPNGSFGTIDGVTGTLEQWQNLDSIYTSLNGDPFDPGDPVGPPPPLDPGDVFPPFDPGDPRDPGGNAPRSWGDDPLSAAGIEIFTFSDGTSLTREELAALVGASENSGDNTITSGIEGGTLDGGAGNDVLEGGAGDDIYVFDAGYDSDVARDSGGNDELRFGDGLARGALTLTRTGPDLNDLLIEVGGIERTALYVEGQFAGDGREIEAFSFEDGTMLTAEEIRQSLLTRSISNRDNDIVGFETDDVIDARRGDDVIEVRGGTDLVDGGEGFDTVVLRGPRSNYVVENEDGRIVVTDLTGRDGVNRLYNVERLVFADEPQDPAAETEISLIENQAPVANDVTLTVNEDGRLVIFASDILAAVTDPDGSTVELLGLGDPSSGTLTPGSDGRFVFEPADDATTDVTISYSVRDAAGAVTTGNITVEINPVNDAPTVRSLLADVVAVEDGAISVTLPVDAFSDRDGDALTLEAALADGSALPDWLIFDPAAGTFTGTPPANLNGSFDIRVTASDGEFTATQSFVLDIEPANDAPVAVLTISDATVQEGNALTINVQAGTFEDIDGDTLIYTASLSNGDPLPAWLTFDAASLSFSGTPVDVAAPVLDVVLTASDGAEEASTAFQITVESANSAPIVAMPIADQSSPEDAFVSFALPSGTFADADGDALSFEVTLENGDALPEWLSFDPASRTISGQPPENFFGSFAVRVTASDGIESASDVFGLEITPENDAPFVATAPADQIIDEDGALVLSIADVFGDVDNEELTITAVAAGGAAVAETSIAGDTLTVSPVANLNGPIVVTLTASDGTADVSTEFSLTVNPVNDGPEAADDDGFTVDEGQALTIAASDLLVNDRDIDGDTLSIVSVSGAANGSVALNSAGDVVFTADGGDGPASFSYTISDGQSTDTATVSLIVETVDGPTDPYADYRQGTEGRDFLFGSFFSPNQIFGAGGNDWVFGGLRDDALAGGEGNDRLFGFSGRDFLEGNAGNDRLFGGWHDDVLEGGSGGDRLFGQSGDDVLKGGTGRDKLWGGSGSDKFVFGEGDGIDVIKDYHFDARTWWGYTQPGDKFELDIGGVDSFADLMEFGSQRGRSTVFDFGEGDKLIVKNTSLSQFDEDDFIFS